MRVVGFHNPPRKTRQKKYWSVELLIDDVPTPGHYKVYDDQLLLISRAGYDIKDWYNINPGEVLELDDPIYTRWAYEDGHGWRIAQVEGTENIRTIRGAELEVGMTIMGRRGQIFPIAKLERQGIYNRVVAPDGLSSLYKDKDKVRIKDAI